MSVLNSFTSLNDLNISQQLTTNATTSISASNSYITSIAYTVVTAGTLSTLTIEDAQATPFILVDAAATTAVSTTPTILNFGNQGIFMNNGIKVVTAGTGAATINLWIQGYK